MVNPHLSRIFYSALCLANLCVSPQAYARLRLGLSSTNYLGQGAEGRQDSFSALDLELNSQTQGKWVDSRLLVQSQIGLNDSNYRFIELPEAYVASSASFSQMSQFTLGRRLTQWSALDQTWGTGAFQPRFRWDYLRPQQVGLLGLTQTIRREWAKLTLFYSPLFIPDRGAPLDFADGRIRSISPWVVNPPYEVELQRKKVPVRYDAQIPPVQDIVRQNTFAGQLRLGETYGPWWSASYAYKPMNQLLMSYDAYLSNQTDGNAYATLYPRVAYHHVASMDIGARGKTMGGEISFLADLPVDEFQAPDFRTTQRVGNNYLVSPTFRVNPFHSKNTGEISLSYLRVFGEDPPDSGFFSDGVSSQFDARYPFRSAFLFSAQLPEWRRLTTDVRMLFDLENPGSIVSWNFSYVPERNWRLFLSTDVLTSFSEEVSDGRDFIQRYRENDRLAGGVTYVF